MSTSIYVTQEAAKQEMIRRLDGDLSDLRRLTMRRHGSGYAIEFEAETLPLPLTFAPGVERTELQGTARIDSGPPTTSAISVEGPEPGGRGSTLASCADGQEPQPGTDRPTRSALPEIHTEPLQIVVMVHEQDFRRDQISGVIDSDPIKPLNRQITIETHDLPDDAWSALMAAARAKRLVRLAVRLIVSGDHTTNRSRVVATQMIGTAQPAQQALF